MTRINFLFFIAIFLVILSCSEDSQEPLVEKTEEEYRITSSKYYFADQAVARPEKRQKYR